MDLKNRVAIITGASSGIGRAIALAMAGDGARLVLTARRADKLQDLADEIATLGSDARVVIGDITLAETAEIVTETALRAFGAIDVLVNNAGYAPPMMLVDLTEDIWDVTLNSCLKSMYLMTRAALPAMLRQDSGRIVQISSVAGKHGYATRTAYCAAKWGMQGFTEALREEITDTGLRIHTVHPGSVATEWWDNTDDPQSTQVLERMMDPEDIAQAVIWVLIQPDNVQIDEVVVKNYRSPWTNV
ncbi:MAG: SDR family oxidoreductase [Anaerolineae bacterium]|nr:SDR family oxidoreductase [Anaerolineae bacterium]